MYYHVAQNFDLENFMKFLNGKIMVTQSHKFNNKILTNCYIYRASVKSGPSKFCTMQYVIIDMVILSGQ